jgi:hypothetical protein
MLLVRPDADDVARPDLLDRAAPTLVESAAEGDDQRLTERVRVPVAAGAWLEGHVRGVGAPGRAGLERGGRLCRLVPLYASGIGMP